MNNLTDRVGVEALATPFELAQIAIALAIMRGEKQPDVDGAVVLLKQTSLRAQAEKRPKPRPRLILDGPPPVINKRVPQKTRSFDSLDAETQSEHLRTVKDFLGSDQIIPPTNFPTTFPAFWRSLLGRRPSEKEKDVVRKRFKLANPKDDIPEIGRLSEFSFWHWARTYAPHVNRFAKLYGRQPTKRRRSKAEGSKGQLKSQVRDSKGRLGK